VLGAEKKRGDIELLRCRIRLLDLEALERRAR
jgi:hypothetical protein